MARLPELKERLGDFVVAVEGTSVQASAQPGSVTLVVVFSIDRLQKDEP